MNKIVNFKFLHLFTWLFRAIFVLFTAVVVTVIANKIAIVIEAKVDVNSVWGALLSNRLIVLVIILFLISSVMAAIFFVQKREIKKQNKDLQEKISDQLDDIKREQGDQRASLKEKFKRFEDIQKVRYGYVVFEPTIGAPTIGNMKPKGVGIDLLDKVFASVTLEDPEQKYTWDNIIQKLNAGEFDIIATPLYDIKERRRDVEFSTPIFYTDIGIFTSSTNRYLGGEATGKQHTFRDAIDLINQCAPQLTIKGYIGELQTKLCNKYFPTADLVELQGEFDLATTLVGLNAPRDAANFSDLIFCERAQAESSEAFKNKNIRNILQHGQLLFPVCYAIRKGEDTLRKYVNYRLMEIEGKGESGIYDYLVKSTKAAFGDYSDSLISEFYKRGDLLIVKDDKKDNVTSLRPRGR